LEGILKKGLDLDIHEGDILDVDAVTRAVEGMDGVVHLAAQTGVPGSLEDPYYDCETNVIGTLNMLEAIRDAEVKRFVFASSNAPLGRQTPPTTKDKAPLSIAPYGASKLAGEGYCLAYYGSWGLGTVVLRFANIYGPFSVHKSSVVSRFFKDVLTQGKITINGDGEQTRDFIYVRDLTRVIILALENKVAGEIFQIATGVETSITELSTLVQEQISEDISIHYGTSRQGDIRKNYSNITKAKGCS
jgi:UDP-glucose 4-epimerase